jgi:hypothetical protein
MIHFRRRVLKLYQNRPSNLIIDVPVNKKTKATTNRNNQEEIIKKSRKQITQLD